MLATVACVGAGLTAEPLGFEGETAGGGDDVDDDGDALKLGFSVERRPDGVVGDVSDGVDRFVGAPSVCWALIAAAHLATNSSLAASNVHTFPLQPYQSCTNHRWGHTVRAGSAQEIIMNAWDEKL